MPTPDDLLAAVRELNLPATDWQEIKQRLNKPQPSAADFAFIKAVIRARTLETIPTQISETDANALAKAEEAAADMAVASLRAVQEDIDTVATALKHGEPR